MAEVHLPFSKHMALRRPINTNIPFILSSEYDYLDGHNEYLQLRCAGRISPADVTAHVLNPRPLSFAASMQCAHFLCDFQTFCETPSAHPDIDVIKIEDVREWHILDLYSDAMHRGLWSDAFYRKGIVQSLDPMGTINPRIKENMRCFIWLAAAGYAPDFHVRPQFEAILDSIKASHTEFISKMPIKEGISKRKTRRSPGGEMIPSPQFMVDWLNAVPKGALRIAAIGIHEHGWRRAEICHQILLPGCEHIRDREVLTRLNMWHPSWNDRGLVLQHDLQDPRMIGVIPLGEWQQSEETPKVRIIGKGNKIRLSHLKRGWLKRVEKYKDTDRFTRVYRRKDLKNPANLLIDRDGKPLTPGALYKAFVRASASINSVFHITPHVLRHIFACRFLQVAIEVDARRAGYDIDELTRKQMEDFAELPIESLALELGHASIETTRIYVEMLVTSWLAPRYHRAWNSVLDAVE